jgi:excisionase family DNA binding protein
MPPSKTSRRPRERVVTPAPDHGALLFTRAQVAALLNVSTMTVIRLTSAGRLKPIRLTPGKSGKVFFRASDVFDLAQGGDDAR